MLTEHGLWLAVLGLVVGAFGTLIGAGGGFVLMPVLLLLYPDARPETVTSISLAVVFFNALSGSWAYARMGRVDYRSGLLFAAATVPGAIAGALTANYIPRREFNAVFGILIIAAGLYLLLSRVERKPSAGTSGGRRVARTLVEKSGTQHAFSFNPRLGVGLSLIIGYVSSLLGIGGGVIHVPVLVRLLDFPVHVAAATSHFILAIMAFVGTVVHVATGSFSHGGVGQTLYMAVGVLIGAQAGAKFSTMVRGIWIVRALAVGLASVGVRILLMAVTGE